MLNYFKIINKKSLAIMMIFILTSGVLISGCSSREDTIEDTIDISAVDVGEKIKQAVKLDDMQEGDMDKLQRLYNIQPEEVESSMLYTASTNIKADEIALIKAKDVSNLADIKEKISKRVEDKAKSFQGYLPDEYYLIKKHVLKTKGNFVLLAISEDADKIEQAFDEALSNKSTSIAENNSYKTIFSNSVFLGDSIIGGLTNDDLLDSVNVMGGLGATVEFTLENVDELVRRNPEYVFLSLGQNNIKEPLKKSKENFQKQYSKLVVDIKEKLPNSKIYILSITPVSSDDEKTILSNKNIDEYNLVLKDIANTEQVNYIDLSPIFKNNVIHYDGDGSHFKNDFYPLLLDYLKEKTDIETQQKKSKIIDSNDTYKQTFKNSVFMGDNIIGALAYLDKLDKENVIAPSGATLDLLSFNVERLASRKPEHIFILIGSNDIRLVSEKQFIEKYSKLINSIKEKLPNSKINILSITPVSADTLDKEPNFKNIKAYNESLQELATTEKINYIDLWPIFKNNTIQYAKNGIHFKPDFYSLFLDYIKSEL